MKKLIIFDFDGVLVDTIQLWYDINRIYNPDLPFDEYSSWSEINFFDALSSAITDKGYKPHPEARSLYHDKLLATISMDEVMKSILTHLYRSHHLTIITGSSEETINTFLKQESVDHMFGRVMGLQTHKSKVIKIQQLLQEYNMDPRDVIFITDTLGDIREAHEAGIRTIGVTWGLHTYDVIQKGNPHTIAHTPENLVDIITSALGTI